MLILNKIILFCFLTSLTQSWSNSIHMLIAAIAQERLQVVHPYAYLHFQSLIESINFLVDNRSRTFIQSSCWADDIQGKQYQMNLWNDWHFIDQPSVTNGTFPIINFTESSINSVSLLDNAIRVLQTNINKNTAERALFARYLIHVVSDLHQPLHSVTFYNESFPEGDKRGYLTKIYFKDKEVSLHQFWDTGAFQIENSSWYLQRPLNQQNITALLQRAKLFIKQQSNALGSLIDELDASLWAMESLQIAKKVAYTFTQKSKEVDDVYEEMVWKVVKRRIVLGGYRLANMIIKIYDGGIKKELVERKWERMKKFAIQLQ